VRDPVLLFNVGALRDDVGRKLESIEACGRAIRTDPAMANGQLPIANCHRNSLLLCEHRGSPPKGQPARGALSTTDRK
jgi:hypothetical protein